VANDDGTIDLHVGSEAPEGKEANWLPTAGGRGFLAILRLYGPGERAVGYSWKPGDLEKVEQPAAPPACPCQPRLRKGAYGGGTSPLDVLPLPPFSTVRQRGHPVDQGLWPPESRLRGSADLPPHNAAQEPAHPPDHGGRLPVRPDAEGEPGRVHRRPRRDGEPPPALALGALTEPRAPGRAPHRFVRASSSRKFRASSGANSLRHRSRADFSSEIATRMPVVRPKDNVRTPGCPLRRTVQGQGARSMACGASLVSWKSGKSFRTSDHDPARTATRRPARAFLMCGTVISAPPRPVDALARLAPVRRPEETLPCARR
jgi:hypothetical protein